MEIVTTTQVVELTVTLRGAPNLRMAQRDMPQSVLTLDPDTATIRFEDGVFQHVIFEKRHTHDWRVVKVFHADDSTFPDWVADLVDAQAPLGAMR